MERAAELERKRQKLAELRKAREERKIVLQSPIKKPQQNVEQLVASLVGTKEEKQAVVKQNLSRHSQTIADIKPPLTVTMYDKSVQVAIVDSDVRQQIMDNEVPKLIEQALAARPVPGVEVKVPTVAKEVLKPKLDISKVLESLKLKEFIESSVKVFERAFDEKHYDILTDYTSTAVRVEGGKTLNLSRSFQADSAVTDLDWSIHFPELSLSALQANDGVVKIWNVHSSQPEFSLKATSPVSCAQFSTFHPNLVVGGVHAGQVVIWDIRVNTWMPVLQSSFTGHTQKVQGLQLVGSSKAHNLTSISEDGVYCSWQMDRLARPLETVGVFNSLMLDCAVSSFGFPSIADTSMFYVGLDDGRVRAVNNRDQAGLKSGIVEAQPFQGHYSSVTSLQFHTAKGGELSELFLTSSFDWTVKLWKKSKLEPLYTFDVFEDYVYDVKWSPVHPGVFACVDGQGTLTIWNITHSAQDPYQQVQVCTQALNKVSWNKFGNKISCAGVDGRVYVYDVNLQSSPKDSAALLRMLF